MTQEGKKKIEELIAQKLADYINNQDYDFDREDRCYTCASDDFEVKIDDTYSAYVEFKALIACDYCPGDRYTPPAESTYLDQVDIYSVYVYDRANDEEADEDLFSFDLEKIEKETVRCA